MTETTKATYARPQDKHGLLRYKREQSLNRTMEELQMLLADYSFYSLLDCACGDGLYTAELARRGYQISAADVSADSGKQLKKRLAGTGVTVPFKQADLFSLEQAYPEKFDVILCLNGELARYEDTEAILRALVSRLNENGILLFDAPDMEDLPLLERKRVYYGKDSITPLLLGVEYAGARYSVIQSKRHDITMEWVVINTIYHIEDLASGAITVDWEEAKYGHVTVADMCELEQCGAWHFHKDVQVDGERLFVCGQQPTREYVGPTYFDDTK